jgi:hypothetical protein
VNDFFYFVGKIIYKICIGKGYFTYSNISAIIKIARIKQDLSKYDLIFSPAQPDIVSRIKTDTPIAFYNDGTVPRMINYYWFGHSEKAIKLAKEIEKRASHKADLLLYSSAWSAKSAIEDYNVNPNKVHVLPFGANIDDKIVKVNFPFYGGETLNLLFSGVDWIRKGGDIAVETVAELNRRGIPAVLTICGARNINEDIKSLPYINYIGFLNKNNSEDYKKYLSIWENTHLFILPTRAECSATVLNEAAAYGVPAITTDTGGLADYVINDINGYRLPLSANGNDYANVIQDWIKENKFESYSQGARKLYEESNSWSAWGKNFNKLLNLDQKLIAY